MRTCGTVPPVSFISFGGTVMPYEAFYIFCCLFPFFMTTLGAAAVGYRTESMHGAGSPQAQRVMIARQGNIEAKKELAKKIANIK